MGIWRVLGCFLRSGGYGIRKFFQGIRVVPLRRDLLEIPLKTKPLAFSDSRVFFLISCSNNPCANKMAGVIAYFNGIRISLRF